MAIAFIAIVFWFVFIRERPCERLHRECLELEKKLLQKELE